jgi:orotate phosphoribosyltransferase
MVEGEVEKGQNVVVIEDLISTAGSSMKAIEALRDRGCNVKGMLAIFTYGFEEANINLKKANCTTYTLCDYDTLIEVALKQNYITENDLESLKQWKVDPFSWNK